MVEAGEFPGNHSNALKEQKLFLCRSYFFGSFEARNEISERKTLWGDMADTERDEV
jgi:hypothetical protein